jgi:hypothetical protein
MAKPPDLTTFARNLSWTGALMDCCHAWVDAYGDLLDRRFRAYCQRNAQLAWLLTAYLGLPDGLRKEFLLCPLVSDQLLIRDAGHVPAFAAMAADFVRVLARSSASAAADPDLAEMFDSFGRDHGEVRGIPLDFDSTLSFPSRGANGRELRTLQPDCAAQARQHVEAALQALEQGNPIALEYVLLLTRCLAIREDEGRPAGIYASGSFPHWIGLTLLTNVLGEEVDAVRLLDALVHEAMHAGLCLYEVVQGPLFPDKNWPNRVRSPWTGNSLDCYTYIQACFVWFGLAHLWGNWPAGAAGVSCERASQMHRRASQGFQARPVQALMSHAGWRLVPPPVQDALHLLEQSALDTWGEE